jgi:hypothetical protein
MSISTITRNPTVLNSLNSTLNNLNSKAFGNYYVLASQYFNDFTITAGPQSLSFTFNNTTSKLNYNIKLNMSMANTTITATSISGFFVSLNGSLARTSFTPSNLAPNDTFTISTIANANFMVSGVNTVTITFTTTNPLTIFNYWYEVSTNVSINP